MPSNLETARRYLAAIEAWDTSVPDTFFTADALQEEFPNRLVPNGAQRDVEGLRQAAARGQQVLSSQTYEVLNAIEQGDQIVLEVQWTGTLAIPVGAIPAGGQMRCRSAMVLEFRDGRIARQRNYDCFEAF